MMFLSRSRSSCVRLASSALALGVLLFAEAQAASAGAGKGAAVGPDVTVYYLEDNVSNYGAVSGERGYALGTSSCNQGNQPLNWCNGGCTTPAASNQHPVIAQNIYRLKSDRFEQIGMSWLKHGFTALALSAPNCGDGSCDNPGTGDLLGVGCVDPYSASLNGTRPMGMRSEVNSATGAYPFPFTQIGSSGAVQQRVRVLESDMTTGNGERYFGEAQYISPDDAAAGNGLNNASYRELGLSMPGFVFQFLSTESTTVREVPAMYAWQAIDPTVEIIAVDIPGSSPTERFHVARKVTDLGGGNWHYEYAIRNLNSDRAARSFRAIFQQATTISNAGAHFINHHSGEPYSTTPWTLDTSVANEIGWSTEDFATNTNANALRWATQFNFWFDATQPPGQLTNTLGIFKPGSPTEVGFFLGPNIFDDGFETGDTSAWSLTVP